MKIEYLDRDELIPYKKNAKRHPDDQIEKIANSISEFGWTIPILIDYDRVIIAGHGRWLAAGKLKINTVPVIYADDLTPKQIKAYRMADNKLSESSWDRKLLAEELKELSVLDFNLNLMGFGNEEIAKLLPDYTLNPGNTDPDQLPDISSDVDTDIITGDLFHLGRHRLVCGDCRKDEIINILMGKTQADMIFSDPPYGVDHSSKNNFFNAFDKGHIIKKPIIGDNLNPDQLCQNLLTPAFKQMKKSLKKGGAYYLTGPGGCELILSFLLALKESGLGLYHLLTWVKNSLVLGRSDYNYKHENIFIGWKDLTYESQPLAYGWNESGHKFYGTSNEVTVWNINRPTKSELHPTMKPVELMVRAIHNSTIGSEIVADFFGGSGSTLIACEQTGRICYMIEVDRHYCQTIISRWEEFTGQKAVKIGR